MFLPKALFDNLARDLFIVASGCAFAGFLLGLGVMWAIN